MRRTDVIILGVTAAALTGMSVVFLPPTPTHRPAPHRFNGTLHQIVDKSAENSTRFVIQVFDGDNSVDPSGAVQALGGKRVVFTLEEESP